MNDAVDYTHTGDNTAVTAFAGPANLPATEEDYRRLIGRRARIARVDLGLSQNDIATKAGLTRNFVSAIERGAQGLDTWRLRHLAEALGVDFGWLLGLMGRPVTSARPGPAE